MAKEKNKDVSKATEKTTEKKTTKKAIKSIPAMPFEDVLHLSQAIWECSSGTRVRKITLFDHLGKSPDIRKGRNKKQLIKYVESKAPREIHIYYKLIDKQPLPVRKCLENSTCANN